MRLQALQERVLSLASRSPFLTNVSRAYSVKLPSTSVVESTSGHFKLEDKQGDEALHTLVLLRHGESQWNTENRYTGWCDVPLTPTGEGEARTAGRLLFESGIGESTQKGLPQKGLQPSPPSLRVSPLSPHRFPQIPQLELDCAHTSLLKRASFSTNMALNTSFQHWVPVNKTWRLNERHYGALQGYNKDSAFEELGIDQEMVMRMR